MAYQAREAPTLGDDDVMLTHPARPANARPIKPNRHRASLHAINEFASGVQFMSELEESKPQEAHVGDLVKELVLALQGQARTRPHPLLYVNLAFVLTLAFWSGVQWQRVNTLESTVNRYQAVEGMAGRVDALSGQMGEVRSEMGRLRDRLEKFMDNRGR
jgi:hypothetical protein